MVEKDKQFLEKELAAKEAVDKYVKDSMILGVGSGSTVLRVIEHLGEKLKEGWNIITIPSSYETKMYLNKFHIKTSTFDEYPEIDLTIDGADEVSPELNLIKGGGAALFREKVVAAAANKLVIVIDSSKFVPKIGTTWPIPIEVHPFALGYVLNELKKHNISPLIRNSGKGKSGPVVTDNGGVIVDAKIPPIDSDQVHEYNKILNEIPGIMEHGLFVDMTDHVIIGDKDKVKHLP